jgi:hypothetical protein
MDPSSRRVPLMHHDSPAEVRPCIPCIQEFNCREMSATSILVKSYIIAGMPLIAVLSAYDPVEERAPFPFIRSRMW